MLYEQNPVNLIRSHLTKDTHRHSNAGHSQIGHGQVDNESVSDIAQFFVCIKTDEDLDKTRLVTNYPGKFCFYFVKSFSLCLKTVMQSFKRVKNIQKSNLIGSG